MSQFTQIFSAFCIRNRVAVVCLLGVLTLALGYFAVHVQIKTVFMDMLPLNHPWIQTAEKYKTTFGGTNMVSIIVTAEHGDIFQSDILKKVQKITQEMQQVKGVNQFQIVSLASRKLKSVSASSMGVETKPLMWPDVPETAAGISELEKAVLQNPLVYGHYVSKDLKSTLITVDFIDRLVDYSAIFPEIRKILQGTRGPDVHIGLTGQPILYGWVRHYLPQTLIIALITILAFALTLFVLVRTWRGILLPLLSGSVSCLWALGVAQLLGYNFDPLIVVVAFLITARSISHSVQLATRFDDINKEHPGITSRDAASMSLKEMFRPGSLGVIADAGAMLVVFLTPIPLLQKISIIGTIWVSTILVSAVVLTPVLLSWIKTSGKHAHSFSLDKPMHWILEFCLRMSTGRPRFIVAGIGVGVFVIAGVLALKVAVGDVRPGSPILWPDSDYNQSASLINSSFPGANTMYVVFHGDKKNVIKNPDVLFTMQKFQRYMEIQPDVGGAESLVDIVSTVNQTLHENNPRYYDLGNSAVQNGQYLYMFVSGSEPGDIQHYADLDFQNAAVTFSFRNHTGTTIRTAFSRVESFIEDHPLQHVTYQLAGGLIGVMAAVNDVLLKGQMEAIALGLLVVILCAMVGYRSTVAGMLFMIPVLISNAVTFAYMTLNHIGLNINTVPVVALGIGLGIDYSFYIIDGIKEDLAKHDNIMRAMTTSLHSAGRGVLITGVTVVVGVVLWMFSSLRFQAEMGILIAIWLSVSVVCALLLMPALLFIFKPRFVFGDRATAVSYTLKEGSYE